MSKKIMNVYVITRADNWGYDECVEQTIVAENEENALKLANREYGMWKIKEVVDLTQEQVLTQNIIEG